MANHRLRRPITLIILYTGLFIFLFSTDPRKLAIGWLILPFLWLFLSLYLTVIYTIDWYSTDHQHNHRQSVIAILAAAIPTAMLLLDSVDQLTIKDGMLIFGLGALALFYTNKISLKRKIF